MDDGAQMSMAAEGKPAESVRPTSWNQVARRVITSVEMPDYDTRVSSLLRPSSLLRLTGCLAAALTTLFLVWWIGATFSWILFGILLLISTVALAAVYKSDVRRISGPEPSWDSDEALIVRAAAVTGDTNLAPLAVAQPSLSDAGGEAAGAQLLTGLYHPTSLVPINNARTQSLALSGLNGALQIGLFILFKWLPNGPPFAWVIGDEGAFLLMQPLWQFAQRFWERQPISVIADAQGLTWRRWGRRRTLAWSAAQALCVIEAPPTSSLGWPAGVTQRIYWLQGPDGAFTWASRPYARRRRWWCLNRTGDDAPLVASYDAQAWRLCALAASRTSLPLRDMTASMNALTALWPRVVALRQAVASSLSRQTSSAEQWRIATMRAIQRRRTRVAFGAMTALGVLALVAALTLAIGAPLAYGDQLRQAEGRAPLFSDTLAAPSGQWPDGAAKGATFIYSAASGYTASSDFCCSVVALATPTLRDGVIEVTLHQVTAFYLASAGIVLRADTATHRALVFAISPDGEWKLQRFTLSADGRMGEEGAKLIQAGFVISEGAIHQGRDTRNRLAVMMRGGSFAFFINGQYVASYHDTQDTGDRVGLYSDDLGDTTSFSDFALYPAPPASLLFPV